MNIKVKKLIAFKYSGKYITVMRYLVNLLSPLTG